MAEQSFGHQRTSGPDGKQLPAGILTASGVRMDLTDRKMVNQVSAMRMGWQTHAWDYRDLVPELAGAMRFRANAISKVALKVGQVVEGEDEPIDADSDQSTLSPALKKAAQDALNKLPWRSGYAFLGVFDTCYSISGECWLHGRTDPATKRETWQILSSDEVVPIGSAGNLGVVEVPGRPGRKIDPKSEVLIRLWVPHPRFKKLSDSPLRSLQDVLEDIILAGREMRAASRSRIAANGILFVTHDMSLSGRNQPNSDTDEIPDFVTELTAAILAPIADEGEPGAVAPIIIEGDREDIQAVKHLTFVRETSADLGAKLDRSLTRMAESIDVPPTVVTGLQDTNHWNAYVIDATTFRNHLEPGVRMMVDSLTEGYLRPSLVQPVTQGGYGLDPVEVEQVVVWYDAGKVTENANRAQDAKDAYDRFAISPKALRDALGWNQDDAPEDADLLLMLANKVGTDPTTAGQLIQKLLPGLGIQVAPPAAPAVPRVVNAPNEVTPPQRPALPAGRESAPGGSVPHQNPSPPPTSGSRVASAAGIGVIPLRVISTERLAVIDAGLVDRLMVAADDAIARAIEKANARIRSAAQKKIDKGDLTEHADDLGAFLGADRVAELGVTEDVLLAAAFAYLEGKFLAWTAEAIKNAVLVAQKMLGLELSVVAGLRRTLIGRQKGAWAQLHEDLRKRALSRLYGTHGSNEPTGEANPDDVARVGDIRASLATIGGSPAGGLATGPTITDLVTEKAGPEIGIMWRYGPEPRNTFRPHLALDDHRFNSRSDPRLRSTPGNEWVGEYFHPGDHVGCRCSVIRAWAFPQNADTMHPELRQAITETVSGSESAAMKALRIVAEQDDAAGRSNTTAQQQRDQRDLILSVQADWLAGA